MKGISENNNTKTGKSIPQIVDNITLDASRRTVIVDGDKIETLSKIAAAEGVGSASCEGGINKIKRIGKGEKFGGGPDPDPSCQSGFEKFQGECVVKCGIGFTRDMKTGLCVEGNPCGGPDNETCSDPNQYWDGSNCVDKPPRGATTFGLGTGWLTTADGLYDASTGTWHSDAISDLSKHTVLRPLNWNNCNKNTTTSWSSRHTGNSVGAPMYNQGSSGGQVSYENQISLCNSAGVDLWINIPTNASDAYVTSLVTLCKNTLTNKAYFELSNEIWNWGFSHFNIAGWPEPGAYGDSSYTAGTPSQSDALDRMDTIFGIVKSVYNDDTKWETVLAYQTEAWANTKDDPSYNLSVTYRLEQKILGMTNRPTAFAINAYHGHGAHASTTAYWDALDPAGDSWETANKVIPIWRGFADDLGMKLFAYEGGPHAQCLDDNSNSIPIAQQHGTEKMGTWIKSWMTHFAPMFDCFVMYQWTGAWGGLNGNSNNNWGFKQTLSDNPPKWREWLAYVEDTGSTSTTYNPGSTIDPTAGDVWKGEPPQINNRSKANIDFSVSVEYIEHLAGWDVASGEIKATITASTEVNLMYYAWGGWSNWMQTPEVGKVRNPVQPNEVVDGQKFNWHDAWQPTYPSQWVVVWNDTGAIAFEWPSQATRTTVPSGVDAYNLPTNRPCDTSLGESWATDGCYEGEYTPDDTPHGDIELWNGECKPKCGTGKHRNPTTGVCESCPDGEFWDEKLQICKVPDVDPDPDPDPDNGCDPGFENYKGDCVAKCPAGEHRDYTTGLCVANAPRGDKLFGVNMHRVSDDHAIKVFDGTTGNFTDEIIEDFSQLDVIRYMDCTGGNVKSTGFNALTKPGAAGHMDYNFMLGSPQEAADHGYMAHNYMWNTDVVQSWHPQNICDLSNASNTSPWFVIWPRMVEDLDYMKSIASMFKEHLNSNLTVYFEYGNELWQSMGHPPGDWNFFYQNQLYCVEHNLTGVSGLGTNAQGHQFVNTPFNVYGGVVGASKCFKVIEEILGSPGTNHTSHCNWEAVGAGQRGTGGQQNIIDAWDVNGSYNKWGRYPTVYSIAPYVDGGCGASPDGAIAIINNHMRSYMQIARTNADSWGAKLGIYEGGPVECGSTNLYADGWDRAMTAWTKLMGEFCDITLLYAYGSGDEGFGWRGSHAKDPSPPWTAFMNEVERLRDEEDNSS